MTEEHQHRAAPGGVGASEECSLCPVCVLLQALSSARPEVTRHLLAAGRELTMALQVLLEQHAEPPSEGAGDPPIERIDVE